MMSDIETAERPYQGYLIARHAENMLWLARYVERVENLGRLLDVTQTFARDEADAASWISILRINADEARFRAAHGEPSRASVARFYLLDRSNFTSVQAAMDAARDNARTLRALLSTEMWLQINVFHRRVRSLSEADTSPEGLSPTCDMLKEGVQAHTGITEGTFYRDQAACFYQIGRHLERADQTTRLLDIKLNLMLPRDAAQGSEIDTGQWHALLRAAAGYHAYRRMHPHGYSAPEVAAFLLLDESFPRSVAANVARMEEQLHRLRTRHGLPAARGAIERLDDLRSELSLVQPDALLRTGFSGFMDWVQRQLVALQRDIAAAFFPGAA